MIEALRVRDGAESVWVNRVGMALDNVAVKFFATKRKQLPSRPRSCSDEAWTLIERMCKNELIGHQTDLLLWSIVNTVIQEGRLFVTRRRTKGRVERRKITPIARHALQKSSNAAIDPVKVGREDVLHTSLEGQPRHVADTLGVQDDRLEVEDGRIVVTIVEKVGRLERLPAPIDEVVGAVDKVIKRARKFSLDVEIIDALRPMRR